MLSLPDKQRVLKPGYKPEDYFDSIDVKGGHVIYPDGSIIKSLRSHACFEVTGHLPKGVHMVESVGFYPGAGDPPEQIPPERIYGMADNRCRLVVHGEEVLFSGEFEEFKEISDDLLGRLPEEQVGEFTESEDFELYRDVMENGLVVPYKSRKRFTQIVDDLLGKLPQGDVEEFVESDQFGIYEKVADHYRVT